MKSRGELPPVDIERVLGVGGEAEIIPLFVPSHTFRMICKCAAERGCTAAEWLERAILQYAQPAEAVVPPAPVQVPDVDRKPAFMVKRKK